MNQNQLLNALGEYNFYPNDTTKQALLDIVPKVQEESALALAIKFHFYNSALLLLNNAKKLHININAISYDKNGNALDIHTILEESLSKQNNTKIKENDTFYQNYPYLMTQINQNIESLEKIKEKVRAI